MSTLPPEYVQDYPRPPLLEPVTHNLRVILAGETVAETVRGLRVLETHHAPTYYFPSEDIAATLVELHGSTICEWKGRAVYFDVVTKSGRADRAAWSYPEPNAGFEELADHVAFYAGAMEACYVGAERVEPQPGAFYGGWITSNLKGHVKGAAGTEFW